MSDGRERVSGRGALLWLGGALLLARAWLGGGLAGEAPAPQPAGSDSGEYRRELMSYIIGFGLAVVLTGFAFGLVHWSLLPHFWLLVAIGAFAVVQMIVHFRFFLHIDLSQQKREDLQLILFSTLILALMVGGTIWILDNLAVRM